MLSPLLAPFIALMNRLSYANKFLLISFIFTLPLLWLAILQLNSLSESLKQTQQRHQGLKAVDLALKVVSQHELLRDRRTLLGVEQEPPAQQPQIFAQLNQQLQQLSQMPALQTSAIKQQLSRLQQFEAARKPTQYNLPIIFASASEGVTASWQLVRNLSYSSGLAQDPDIANFLLMKLLIDELEPLYQALGSARAFAGNIYHTGQNSDAAGEAIDGSIDQILQAKSRFNSYLEVLEREPNIIRFNRDELNNSIDQAQQVIVEQVLDRFEYEGGPEPVFSALSQPIEQVDGIAAAALGAIEQALMQRHQQQQQRFYTLLGAIIVVLIVAGCLFLAFFLSVRDALGQILNTTQQVAAGDLTSQTEVNTRDELGTMAQAINQMIDQMHRLIEQVLSTSASTTAQADQVEQIAAQSREAVERQCSETEQVATAINQMVASVQEVAKHCQTAAQESDKVRDESARGQQVVGRTLDSIHQLANDIQDSTSVINQLATESDNISQVLVVIRGIAEQTNLLALNAAIEAARAGEQGRGFAVVADEVRSLAQRTQDSTAEIEAMIGRLQSGVSDAVQAMDRSSQRAGSTVDESQQVRDALDQIETSIHSVADVSLQIASAAEQQTSVAEEIDRNVVSISAVGQQTAAGARETAEASHEVSRLAQELSELVRKFKV